MFNAVYFPCQDSNTGRQTEPSSRSHPRPKKTDQPQTFNIIATGNSERQRQYSFTAVLLSVADNSLFLKKRKEPKTMFPGRIGRT